MAIKWRRLGDTVLWTSALGALAATYPSAEIDLALPAPYLPLFASDPRFTRRIALERGLGHALELRRTLRARRYDLALCFHASSRSLLVTRLAGGRERLVHHHGRAGRRFFSDRPIVGAGVVMAAVERDLNVVRTLGFRGAAPRTDIRPEAQAVSRGAATLAAVLGPGNTPVVLLGIGASRLAKQWPLERYARLAALLRDRARVGILYESEAVFRGREPFRAALAGTAALVHTPRLEDLLGVLPNAACYAGSDSGVKHLAVAVGVPTVTLFGPESVGEWHGYPEDRHRVLQKEVLCRTNDAHPAQFAWCGVETCPLGSHACMAQITPEEVAGEIGSLIG